ncbi:Cys-tRNA(Pro) deacylase [Bacillus sp. V3-13]|uniref:Cys-tRNA(Pro) deacylase n=1 Tax=Bacillus sp. V3-13 TaxID=2053728 RepID=UPI000C787354|nr:Cys-tRNA(Pro) deacylase [Bacillus sp. V3-13]PLR79036.1 Cys-tRNA(Pro) deacylase [Bacillus sp. V3-13]
MAKTKTNAMRILDAKNIGYELISYDRIDGKIDGISVAEKINKSPGQVYKTLVAQSANKNINIFVIPVAEELDLKKAAKAAGEKKIEMIAVKDIQKYTGYIRGGCSPVGMKKQYPTFIDRRAGQLKTIVVSGGKIGVQMELTVENLVEATDAVLADLIKQAD